MSVSLLKSKQQLSHLSFDKSITVEKKPLNPTPKAPVQFYQPTRVDLFDSILGCQESMLKERNKTKQLELGKRGLVAGNSFEKEVDVSKRK